MITKSVIFRRSGRAPTAFAKYCIIGALGYCVNVGVYALLITHAGMHYVLAAATSFILSAAHNYLLNRMWTFRDRRGDALLQGLRFLLVAELTLVGNLAVLVMLVEFGVLELLAQAMAIVVVTPINFAGNKFWSFQPALQRAGPATREISGVVIVANPKDA